MATRAATTLRPMLARLERELPGGAHAFEPKWDGLRCLAFVAEGPRVDLRSRHGLPLARYFPEVVASLGRLPPATLDGELVIRRAAGLDFAALLGRMHPARSRVERLARERPATLVAFDLLSLGGEDLTGAPFDARRARLEALLAAAPPGVELTPATRDPALARAWLDGAIAGVDGVVAKALDQPYLPGKRGWVKVKRERTADCVVGGVRLQGGAPAVASLLLGLWDREVLRHVGVSSSFTEARRRALFEELRPLATGLGNSCGRAAERVAVPLPPRRGATTFGSRSSRTEGSAMAKLRVLSEWPVVRQVAAGDAAGLGDSAMSERTRSLRARTSDADRVARSVCPYCAVGCGQLVYVKDEKIIDIEGDPDSPVSQGCLCPKGAATFQLVTGSQREQHVLYRRPGGTAWERIPLDVATEMVAQRVKKTRDETWEERVADDAPSWAGKRVRRTLGIAHLGGATLDNEENYLLKKLYTALGIVQVENQARI